MLIIPAIDILGGRCVRLRKGDYQQVSEYGDDLIAIAEQWIRLGAKRMHLVDLDGAKKGSPVNQQAILHLARSFPEVAFEVGGGIRQLEHAQSYLDNGVDYVIIGSIACTNPQAAVTMIERFAQQILLGLDTYRNKVKIAGWCDDSNLTLQQALLPFVDSPIAGIIHTDIDRDGMLSGTNFEASAALARETSFPVIASGGVASMDDVKQLVTYAGVLDGVIAGKALYQGTLALDTAIQYLDEHCSC